MGKPFVLPPEREPQLPSSSPVNVFNGNGELDAAGEKIRQGALQASESYFHHLRKSSESRPFIGRHGAPTTLFETLLNDTEEPAVRRALSPQHGTSVGDMLEMNYPKVAPEVESRTSPGLRDMIDLDTSRSEFSLDDLTTSPRASSMFLPPTELASMISPTWVNSDIESPSDFSLDDSDGTHESMSSPAATVVSSDCSLQENEEEIRGTNFAIVQGEGLQSLDGGGSVHGESGQQGAQKSSKSVQVESRVGETEQHVQCGDLSKLGFEWTSVLRRSARSLDVSRESSKTSMSAGVSSARYSLSDEAISERAAAWGNGVARLVLKNSSRESTPRSSTGSMVDGLPCGQKIPGVSKQVRDAISSFQLAFVVCDVINPEKPVLFASAGFFNMTGYSAEEVVGRNCRFLQGVDTDAKEVARISSALKKGEPYSGTVLNYKRNGSPFWNLLTLSPIRDDNGVVIKYMGMQAEVKGNAATSARRQKTGTSRIFNNIPRSVSHSISEEILDPSSLPLKRSERENDVPIFTLPGTTSAVTATCDANGRSQGSRRYSLTYGAYHARSHSVDKCPGRPVAPSERRSSMPSERKRSLAPQQPVETGLARPLSWLQTAARMLEEENQQQKSNQKFAKEQSETALTTKRRTGGSKRTKISRMAKGFVGLLRKVERKVFKRTSRIPMSSNRVNAYDLSESDSETDDVFPEMSNTNDYLYFGRQDPRCESMPHINSTRGGCAANVLMQAELQSVSSRYFPAAAASSRFERRYSVSDTDEFVLDRTQFCIVHE